MLISILYDSGYGHTAKLAESVAVGASSVSNAEVRSIAVADGPIPWDVLEASDAIIFGSPTYNGALSARLKQVFEDSTKAAWSDQKWAGKVAAGFTNSGAMSGDKLGTLISIALFAAQHGMIWVNLDLLPGDGPDKLNRLGVWLGAAAQSDNDKGPDEAPIESDRKTAEHLGRRVAEVATRLAGSVSAKDVTE
jgi:multimeric flavodoxin WrbA